MKKFTFISEYKGGTYISQHMGKSVSHALKLWSKNLDSSIYSLEDIAILLDEVDEEDYKPIPIHSVDSVWACTYLSEESFLLLNIIETV